MRSALTCTASLLFSLCTPLQTQPHDVASAEFSSPDATPLSFSVKHLTVDDGLTENSIWSIIQDRDGFIWIGSFGGINRYDGYDFLTFSSSHPATPHVASSAAGGFALARDPRFLWVSSDLGFHRFDRWTQRFLSYPQLHGYPLDNATLSNDNVQCLLEDASGTLWIGTEAGLNSYTPASKHLIRYPLDPHDPNSLWKYRVTCLLEDSRRAIWIGTSDGLFTVERATRTLIRLKYRTETDSISSLCEDASGNLWVGTMQGDVFVLNAERKLTSTFRVGSTAYSLCPEDSATIWCGTSDGSLLLLNRRTNAAREVRYNGSDKVAHPISSLLKDRSNAVWVGTMGRGVYKLTTPRDEFALLRFDGERKPKPTQIAVWSTLQSRDRNVWIGTGNTLCRLDPATGEYREVVGAPQGHQVRAILEDGNTLWLALLDAGIARWDRTSNRWTRYTHDARIPTSLSSDLVYALHNDTRALFGSEQTMVA